MLHFGPLDPNLLGVGQLDFDQLVNTIHGVILNLFKVGRPLLRPANALPQGITVREVHYDPNYIQPIHEHESATLTLVYRGGLIERVGRLEESAGALSVVVKPPGVPHSDRFGPDATSTLQVVLPRAWLEAERCGWELGSWRWIHGGAAAGLFLALLRELRGGVPEPAEVESRVLELLAEVGPDSGGTFRGNAPHWLETARERIEETYSQTIRVGNLAREAGVHPVSLARAYRRHYGTSVTAAVRRLRVAAVASHLSGSETSLTAVAQVAGFSDQAHMCRVFKSATGLTPLGYRRLTRS